MPKKKTAYSYIRFSTPEQSEGDSLRRQKAGSAELAERKGWILDDSLRLEDLGVSAFKGRNLKEGALGAFLEAIELGKVKKGSVLIVESLDRLSRDTLDQALSLFMDILRRDVEIATLTPEEHYTKESIRRIEGLLPPLVYMQLANEESDKKSHRLSKSWEAKREQIDEKKLTAVSPAWLTLSADRTKWIVDKRKAKAVKLIYRLANEGMGVGSITRKLNSENYPPIARAKMWHNSYITKILHNRSVMGEYQPHTGHCRSRKPLGEPIADYYPQIISEADFYKAQKALESRRMQRGPTGKNIANLFTGILRDARDGCTMAYVDKGKKKSPKPQLVSSGAVHGLKGSEYISISYEAVEAAILKFTSEIKLADLFPSDVPSGSIEDELANYEGKLAATESKIAKCKKRLLSEDEFDSLVEVLEGLEKQKKILAEKVERLKAEIHTAESDTLAETQSLLELIWNSEGEELISLRRKLKAKLRALISEIWVLVSVEGIRRHALIQVHFKSGGNRKLEAGTRRGEIWYNGRPDLYTDDEIQNDLRRYREGGVKAVIPKEWHERLGV